MRCWYSFGPEVSAWIEENCVLPSGEHYELVVQGNVEHEGDPAFTRQLESAVAWEAFSGGWWLSKGRSKKKMQAAVAAAMAAHIAVQERGRAPASSCWVESIRSSATGFAIPRERELPWRRRVVRAFVPVVLGTLCALGWLYLRPDVARACSRTDDGGEAIRSAKLILEGRIASWERALDLDQLGEFTASSSA